MRALQRADVRKWGRWDVLLPLSGVAVSPGQPVLYRVRRLGIDVSRRSRGEYVVLGVGVVRSSKVVSFRGDLQLLHQVERDDGSAVTFDGVGLYDHEVRAL